MFQSRIVKTKYDYFLTESNIEILAQFFKL